MVAKKKTSLRAKAAKGSSKLNSAAAKQIDLVTNYTESEHENPYLKLAKVTKKDKQTIKSTSFIENLKNVNTSSSISKSALRRRKRKQNNDLKPKMQELLASLPETDSNDEPSKTVNFVEKPLTKSHGFIESNKSQLNKPNPLKQTGNKKILLDETKRFKQILKDPSFRASPFDALKAAITANIKNQNKK